MPKKRKYPHKARPQTRFSKIIKTAVKARKAVHIDESDTIMGIFSVICALLPRKVVGQEGLHAESFNADVHPRDKIITNVIIATRGTSGDLLTCFAKYILVLLHKKRAIKVSNYGPMTLVNVVAETFSSVYRNRVKAVLPNIIHSFQTGLVSRHMVTENIIITQHVMY